MKMAQALERPKMYSPKIYYDLARISKMWLEALEALEESEDKKKLRRKYEEEYKMYISIAEQFEYEMGLA